MSKKELKLVSKLKTKQFLISGKQIYYPIMFKTWGEYRNYFGLIEVFFIERKIDKLCNKFKYICFNILESPKNIKDYKINRAQHILKENL